ncbi:MAG: threonine--tRNA ligase [Candidatus Pacebacteria bacterium]|nr:threonine--tRNA ligase [Candidatus Paceibacterota bacterium]
MEIETLRHSISHVLAAAVKELYPTVKFGIGPAIEDGFYYDFQFLSPISDSDLPKIQKKMVEIIKRNDKFIHEIVTKEKAKAIFKDQKYKLELISDLAKEDQKISIYHLGNFTDLCKGPHIKSASEIPNGCFQLIKLAGAYWKGSEQNAMLTRIYGIAMESKTALDKYQKQLEEAKRRDHRILGEKLELYLIDDEVGAGLPIWMPKGEALIKAIERYLYEELRKAGYKWLKSPHIANIQLWKTSGHWGFYRENMYSPIQVDEEQYMIKPMNCPFHIKVYNKKIRSYKELPIKYAELGTVYRYEKSGVLHGLNRVRGFTQDDAHIYCTPEQLEKELLSTLKLGIKMLKDFGFKNYDIYLSTKPEDKHVGSDEIWVKATKALESALKALKLKYSVDVGGGAFYGPKIDIKIKDSIGRPWQCTTIQADFNLPDRFKMEYIDKNGQRQEPIMIHRALLGSIERFVGVLIEHYAGAFPLWLAPEQMWVLPISKANNKYAKEVFEELNNNGFRVELKDEDETIGKKIREAEIQKIPYMIVLGDKETKSKKISARDRNTKKTSTLSLKSFIKNSKELIDNKK